MAEVKFFSMDFTTNPKVRYHLMIPNTHKIICKVCGKTIEHKERFYLCGNMDGSAWCNAHFSDDHFKKYKNFGEDKTHIDYRPWLIVAPLDLFAVQTGETYEFPALVPI